MSFNDKLEVNLKTVTIVTHEVELKVNGESKGTRRINGGPSLLAFCQEAATEFGVNTFEITLDGTPVSVKTAGRPITEVAPSGSAVGVVAQNSRGTDPASIEGDHGDAMPDAATHEGMTEDATSGDDEDEETIEATSTQAE
jgi:hypothetical protein